MEPGVEPGWNRDGTRVELRWNHSGTEVEPQWNRGGTTVEPRWNPRGTMRSRLDENDVFFLKKAKKKRLAQILKKIRFFFSFPVSSFVLISTKLSIL